MVFDQKKNYLSFQIFQPHEVKEFAGLKTSAIYQKLGQHAFPSQMNQFKCKFEYFRQKWMNMHLSEQKLSNTTINTFRDFIFCTDNSLLSNFFFVTENSVKNKTLFIVY